MKFTFCEEDSRFFRRTPRHEMCYDITDISYRTGFGCISERAGRQGKGFDTPASGHTRQFIARLGT